jgi:MFS transporter, DHA1 family, multidrug resistance protein
MKALGQQSLVWIALISLSFGFQPVTTDVYLSTLPALAEAFKVSQRAIDSTLQTYLVSYAVVQLFIGPLADRFGRRPMLLGALIIYLIASLLGAFSPSLASLNFARATQAVGVCAAIIAARAIVRDLLEPQKGAALLAKAMSFMGVIALTCPPIGGLLQNLLGWTGAFYAMALYAICVGVFAFLFLPETLKQKNHQALELKALFANYLQIIRHKEFLLYSAVAACAYSALMTFFVKAPVIFIKEYGLSPLQFGFTLSLCTCGFISGTLIGRRLVTLVGIAPSIRVGATLTLAGALLMLGVISVGKASLVTYLVCQLIYMLGHGILQPITQAAAIGPFPEKAGAAGAVLGFLIHTSAALWLLLIGPMSAHWGWPLGLLGMSLLIAAIALRLNQVTIETSPRNG